MRKELFYNPGLLLERLAEFSGNKRRRKVLKGTPAGQLEDSQITSLEFLQLIKKDNIQQVYDLGANAGTWSVLADVLIPGCTIQAFEPIPAYQEKFLASTKHIRNIRLHKVGVGNANKQEKFNVAGHSSSFFEVSENLLKMFPNEKKTAELMVDMVKLDDYVSKNHLPLPDLMKLDVEGYELEVLKNASACMKHCRYIILEVSFIERHIGQPLFHDVVHFMAQHNYRLFSFPEKMHLGMPIQVADVLFKNNEQPA